MIQDVNLIKEKFNKLMENDKTVESLILISKDGLPISSTLSMEEEEKNCSSFCFISNAWRKSNRGF